MDPWVNTKIKACFLFCFLILMKKKIILDLTREIYLHL